MNPTRVTLWAMMVGVGVATFLLGEQLRVLLPEPLVPFIRFAPLVATLVPFLWFYRRLLAQNAKLITATRALTSGHHLEAYTLFTEVVKALPSHAGPKYNLALAELSLWRVQAARTTLGLVAARPKRQSGLLLGTESAHAFAAALENDLVSARAWLEVGENPAASRAVMLITKAAVACREGAWGPASEYLAQVEVRYVGGSFAGVAQALRSFASQRLGRGPRPVDRLLLYGEASSDGLKAVWPELHEAVELSPGVD